MGGGATRRPLGGCNKTPEGVVPNRCQRESLLSARKTQKKAADGLRCGRREGGREGGRNIYCDVQTLVKFYARSGR